MHSPSKTAKFCSTVASRTSFASHIVVTFTTSLFVCACMPEVTERLNLELPPTGSHYQFRQKVCLLLTVTRRATHGDTMK
uniref:Uncharacterized protein n=1 Tax=Hyaloperonospora arabidopsidis (strain Emoy2) TaxID=559515 RepID=M4BKJ8_HYAAE